MVSGHMEKSSQANESKTGESFATLCKEVTHCHSVLIVEDDAEIRESLKEIIELEGYLVFTAPDGKKALEILRTANDKPCLVLLDLMMPVMSGWEVLALREQDVMLATIPVIVVSAAGERAKQTQATGYIKKPVDIDVLLNMIHKYCSQANANQSKLG
jgi:CheY-like chemotaxis protein